MILSSSHLHNKYLVAAGFMPAVVTRGRRPRVHKQIIQKGKHMRPVYDINQTREYSDPKESEPRTIFILGVLDAASQRYIDETFSSTEFVPSGKTDEKGNAVMEARIKPNMAGRTFEAVRIGLKGIKNFGRQLTFTERTYPFGKRTVLDDESMNSIKPFIQEIGLEILKDVEVTEEAEKN